MYVGLVSGLGLGFAIEEEDSVSVSRFLSIEERGKGGFNAGDIRIVKGKRGERVVI